MGSPCPSSTTSTGARFRWSHRTTRGRSSRKRGAPRSSGFKGNPIRRDLDRRAQVGEWPRLCFDGDRPGSRPLHPPRGERPVDLPLRRGPARRAPVAAARPRGGARRSAPHGLATELVEQLPGPSGSAERRAPTPRRAARSPPATARGHHAGPAGVDGAPPRGRRRAARATARDRPGAAGADRRPRLPAEVLEQRRSSPRKPVSPGRTPSTSRPTRSVPWRRGRSTVEPRASPRSATTRSCRPRRHRERHERNPQRVGNRVDDRGERAVRFRGPFEHVPRRRIARTARRGRRTSAG